MKFKGRVKKMVLDMSRILPSYQITFLYNTEKYANGISYGVAHYTDNDTDFELLKQDKSFSAEKEIFDFISAHSKEMLEITYDEDKIVKVELSYE